MGPPTQGYRVKVSNVPDRSDRNNCFTITIPDYKILGEINKSFIDDLTLSKIIEFIRINQEYIVSFSDLNMTVDELREKIIPVVSTGIEDAYSGHINIYPNPTTEILHVVLKDKIEADLKVEVYNNCGVLLHNIQVTKSDRNLEIDLGQCSQGMYMLKIYNAKKSHQAKVIKK